MNRGLAPGPGYRAAPTKQTLHSWAVYHIATKQKFVGIVYDHPDEASAIKAAIELYKVPLNERGRLYAQRRD